MRVAPHILEHRLSKLAEVAIVTIDVNVERVFEIIGTEEIG